MNDNQSINQLTKSDQESLDHFNLPRNTKKASLKISHKKVDKGFLAHLAKGKVSFCHHLASTVCRPSSVVR
jgi:hypothetical protein